MQRGLLRRNNTAHMKTIRLRRELAQSRMEAEEADAEAARRAGDVETLTRAGNMRQAAEIAATAEKARARAAAAQKSVQRLEDDVAAEEDTMASCNEGLVAMQKELLQADATVKQVPLSLESAACIFLCT